LKALKKQQQNNGSKDYSSAVRQVLYMYRRRFEYWMIRVKTSVAQKHEEFVRAQLAKFCLEPVGLATSQEIRPKGAHRRCFCRICCAKWFIYVLTIFTLYFNRASCHHRDQICHGGKFGFGGRFSTGFAFCCG